MSEGERLIAGKDFPWEYIAGYYLLFSKLLPLAEVVGTTVRGGALGAYGLATVELPNPDIGADQRIITLPVEQKGDYKSIYYAELDSGVKAGTNELVLLYEARKGWLGRRKPSLHVAAYPTGTWLKFFEAVTNYGSADFQWPNALFLYQPGSVSVFPASRNLFVP